MLSLSPRELVVSDHADYVCMARRIDTKLREVLPQESNPSCLNRILMANDGNAERSPVGQFVDDGNHAGADLGERLVCASRVSVVEVRLEFSREQLRYIPPRMTGPMRELARLGQSLVGSDVKIVMTCHSSCSLLRPREARADDRIDIFSPQMRRCLMRLSHAERREMEPVEIAVHDVIGIRNLAVANQKKTQVGHGATIPHNTAHESSPVAQC